MSQPLSQQNIPDNSMIVLLALDDVSIPWARGTRLALCKPEKYIANPVVPRGLPGAPDAHRAQMPAVVAEPDRLRMWYVARNTCFGSNGIRIATAESSDGCNWHKPDLGLVECNGSTENNLVDCAPGLNTVSVLPDPEAPAERRYVMVGEDMNYFKGWTLDAPAITRLAVSSDGYCWQTIGTPEMFAQIFEPAAIYRFQGKYHIDTPTGQPIFYRPRYSGNAGVLSIHADPLRFTDNTVLPGCCLRSPQ